MASYAFEINQRKSAVIRFTLCKQYFYNMSTDTYDFIPYVEASAFAVAVNQQPITYSRGLTSGSPRLSTLKVNGSWIYNVAGGYSYYTADAGTPLLVRKADQTVIGSNGTSYTASVYENIAPVALSATLTDLSAGTQRLDVVIPFALTSNAENTVDNPTVWKWYVNAYLTAAPHNDPQYTFDLGSGTVTLTYRTDETRKPNCKSSVQLVVG
jgi:hypothetical protein